MRDLKAPTRGKIKGNKRKAKREPRDWKGIFHRLLRVGVLLGSVALILAAGTLTTKLLFDSEYFRVEEVKVDVAERISREDIVALSDIVPGVNIFELDLDRIGGKIEENPWIAEAHVERHFPREVVIKVSERTPRAIINLGYLYYVDPGGEIFKLLDPEDSLDFPVITGLTRQFLLDTPQEARRVLNEAMSLIEELQGRKRFTLEDVSELNYDAAEGYSLYTCMGGIPIRMGYSNFEMKLDRLERIYKELRPRLPALKYIDLNVVDRVIVKVDTGQARGKG